MARYEEKFKDQGDMEAFLIGLFNQTNPIKKIDVRSYQGGYKVIVKTIEPKEETE